MPTAPPAPDDQIRALLGARPVGGYAAAKAEVSVMPNRANIQAPVSLVGLGRSGTTLLTNVFRRHSEFQALGETANLVFTTYRTLEKTLANAGPRSIQGSDPEAAREGTYSILLSIYHSDRPRWFQKPIFLPNKQEWANYDEFCEWYWRAFAALFPRARIFTVLREPVDVIPSMMARWELKPAYAIGRCRQIYKLFLHRESRLAHAVLFEDLQHQPEETIRKLFSQMDLSFESRCMDAFSREHAPNAIQSDFNIAVPRDVMEMYEKILKKWQLDRSSASRFT